MPRLEHIHKVESHCCLRVHCVRFAFITYVKLLQDLYSPGGPRVVFRSELPSHNYRKPLPFRRQGSRQLARVNNHPHLRCRSVRNDDLLLGICEVTAIPRVPPTRLENLPDDRFSQVHVPDCLIGAPRNNKIQIIDKQVRGARRPRRVRVGHGDLQRLREAGFKDVKCERGHVALLEQDAFVDPQTPRRIGEPQHLVQLRAPVPFEIVRNTRDWHRANFRRLRDPDRAICNKRVAWGFEFIFVHVHGLRHAPRRVDEHGLDERGQGLGEPCVAFVSHTKRKPALDQVLPDQGGGTGDEPCGNR
mmetsp:Transcript_42797/g.87470  ORF Transcript_42797/g.87470 Transcript_42797/m.87470 type:complete len:303 (+) Transcript_42797:451-1359(+)